MKYVGNVRYSLVDIAEIFGVKLLKWWYFKRHHRFLVDRKDEQEFIRYIKANS